MMGPPAMCSNKRNLLQLTSDEPESAQMAGIIPRAIKHIFDRLNGEGSPRGAMSMVRMSYVELYNNQFRDLLASNAGSQASTRAKIELHENKAMGVYLTGSPTLKTPVTSANRALTLVYEGNRRRAQGCTNLNAHSSRSHAILTLHVEIQDAQTNAVKMGKLHLIDLAGSERVSTSGAQGTTLVETQNINLSLATLGDVLSKVVENSPKNAPGRTQPPSGLTIDTSVRSPKFVPYRNSKLTHLLKDSLGGNSKTLIVATLRLDGGASSYQQLLMTLQFASRARNIINNTSINMDMQGSSGGIQERISKIAALQSKLAHREVEFEELKQVRSEGLKDNRALKQKLAVLQQANEAEKRQMEEHLGTMIRHHNTKLEATEQAHQSLQQKLEDYERRCQVLGHQQQQGERKTQEQQSTIVSLTRELEHTRGELRRAEAWKSEAGPAGVAEQPPLADASAQVRKLCKAVQLLDSRLNAAHDEARKCKEQLQQAQDTNAQRELELCNEMAELRRAHQRSTDDWKDAKSGSDDRERALRRENEELRLSVETHSTLSGSAAKDSERLFAERERQLLRQVEELQECLSKQAASYDAIIGGYRQSEEKLQGESKEREATMVELATSVAQQEKKRAEEEVRLCDTHAGALDAANAEFERREKLRAENFFSAVEPLKLQVKEMEAGRAQALDQMKEMEAGHAKALEDLTGKLRQSEEGRQKDTERHSKLFKASEEGSKSRSQVQSREEELNMTIHSLQGEAEKGRRLIVETRGEMQRLKETQLKEMDHTQSLLAVSEQARVLAEEVLKGKVASFSEQEALFVSQLQEAHAERDELLLDRKDVLCQLQRMNDTCAASTAALDAMHLQVDSHAQSEALHLATIEDLEEQQEFMAHELDAAKTKLKERQKTDVALNTKIRGLAETATLMTQNHNEKEALSLARIKKLELIVKNKAVGLDAAHRVHEEELNTLQSKLGSLQASHAAALNDVKATYENEMGCLRALQGEDRGTLVQAHAVTVDGLKHAHQEALNTLQNRHLDTVSELQATHETTMQALQKGHVETTGELQRAHKAALEKQLGDTAENMRELRKAHHTALKKKQNDHAGEMGELRHSHRATLEQQQNEHAQKVGDMVSAHRTALQKQQDGHTDEIGKLARAHQVLLRQQQDDHAGEIDELASTHRTALQNQQNDATAQMRELHEAALQKQCDVHAGEVMELRHKHEVALEKRQDAHAKDVSEAVKAHQTALEVTQNAHVENVAEIQSKHREALVCFVSINPHTRPDASTEPAHMFFLCINKLIYLSYLNSSHLLLPTARCRCL
jgi:hypothetical protein